MRLLLLALAITVSTAANARETFIRCEVKVKMSGVLGTHSSDEVGTRYYVINDDVHTIAIIDGGERKPICWSEAQCDIKVNADAAVFTSQAWPAGVRLVGKTTIDRRIGRLDETSQLYNEKGQPTIFTEVRGPCQPYDPSKRAF